MFKNLLSYILLSMIIAVIYIIWVIQPLPFDDWCITKLHSLFSMPPMPETGQQIRYYFSGMYFFTTSPFSFLRVWSFFTAIVSASLFWAALSQERIIVRSGLTLLVVLGFPYLGHIGAWNHAASIYTVSVVWMILWYISYRNLRHSNMQFLLKGVVFFILTFLAASWHELWLISFAVIVSYLAYDAFSLGKERKRPFKLRSLSVHMSVILAYTIAIIFYTRGGPSQFIDGRLGAPGTFALSLNWAYLMKAFVIGTKGNLLLAKDVLPVWLLILYIQLNKNFENKLSKDFSVFFVIALGSVFFLYVYAFIVGDIVWRVRWLCAVSLSAAFYALPKSILTDHFHLWRKDSFIKGVRFCSICVACIWLSYNAYFTYVYTNIDVAGWLQYRQMVLDRNPDGREELCCRTLPEGRPKGVASWDHVWGAQDDRYRFFMGPSEATVRSAVDVIFKDESSNKFFIY